MKTLTVKVPEELDLKLTAEATRRGESKSTLIRAAIERIVDGDATVTPDSCLDLARDLLGSCEGPEDLSHNKEHLRGYGQ